MSKTERCMSRGRVRGCTTHGLGTPCAKHDRLTSSMPRIGPRLLSYGAACCLSSRCSHNATTRHGFVTALMWNEKALSGYRIHWLTPASHWPMIQYPVCFRTFGGTRRLLVWPVAHTHPGHRKEQDTFTSSVQYCTVLYYTVIIHSCTSNIVLYLWQIRAVTAPTDNIDLESVHQDRAVRLRSGVSMMLTSGQTGHEANNSLCYSGIYLLAVALGCVALEAEVQFWLTQDTAHPEMV